MGGSIVWIVVLVVFLGILKLAPALIRRLILNWLGEEGRAAVGKAAMDEQPARITLVVRPDPPGPEMEAALGELAGQGYQAAGSFVIPEMANLPVRFMVKPADAAAVAIYQHPKVGVWFDIFTRYDDGTSFTLATTAVGGGLDPRPGHPIVRAPGLNGAAAHARFMHERTAGAMSGRVGTEEIASVFADAYAESVAWRKNRGISGAEVRKVAVEKIGPPPRRSARL